MSKDWNSKWFDVLKQGLQSGELKPGVNYCPVVRSKLDRKVVLVKPVQQTSFEFPPSKRSRVLP